jgi:hypothetical protein
MNAGRKRPLGVTLMALPFLWIGCGGAVFFPIILLTGALNDALGTLLSGFV